MGISNGFGTLSGMFCPIVVQSLTIEKVLSPTPTPPSRRGAHCLLTPTDSGRMADGVRHRCRHPLPGRGLLCYVRFWRAATVGRTSAGSGFDASTARHLESDGQ